MRVVFAVVLLIGLGLAGFAVYVAQDRFAQYQAALARQQQALEQSRSVELVKVWVAARPLAYGARITGEDVVMVDWPKASLPEGAFVGEDHKPYAEQRADQRAVLRAIEKFEPILASKVTGPGEDAGVTARLGTGMRAFAIRVDVASGVSGFLRPGDRVDVYWTGQSGNGEITKLILEGISLIAIDQTVDSDRTAPTVARTVTVEVSPKDAAALALAQSTGKLSLSLLGIADTAQVGQVEIDRNELLGIEAAAPVQMEQKVECTIRTRKAGEITVIAIPCPDES